MPVCAASADQLPAAFQISIAILLLYPPLLPGGPASRNQSGTHRHQTHQGPSFHYPAASAAAGEQQYQLAAGQQHFKFKFYKLCHAIIIYFPADFADFAVLLFRLLLPPPLPHHRFTGSTHQLRIYSRHLTSICAAVAAYRLHHSPATAELPIYRQPVSLTSVILSPCRPAALTGTSLQPFLSDISIYQLTATAPLPAIIVARAASTHRRRRHRAVLALRPSFPPS